MAGVTKVHGDFQPVSNVDAGGYTVGALNAVTSAATVNLAGPKLEFFTITANAGMTTTQLASTIAAVQQLATIHMYEYTDATDDTLAIAVYPVGAWDTSTLDTAVTAATSHANVVVTATATFTN